MQWKSYFFLEKAHACGDGHTQAIEAVGLGGRACRHTFPHALVQRVAEEERAAHGVVCDAAGQPYLRRGRRPPVAAVPNDTRTRVVDYFHRAAGSSGRLSATPPVSSRAVAAAQFFRYRPCQFPRCRLGSNQLGDPQNGSRAPGTGGTLLRGQGSGEIGTDGAGITGVGRMPAQTPPACRPPQAHVPVRPIFRIRYCTEDRRDVAARGDPPHRRGAADQQRAVRAVRERKGHAQLGRRRGAAVAGISLVAVPRDGVDPRVLPQRAPHAPAQLPVLRPDRDAEGARRPRGASIAGE
eukprot:gene15206-biopygen6254